MVLMLFTIDLRLEPEPGRSGAMLHLDNCSVVVLLPSCIINISKEMGYLSI